MSNYCIYLKLAPYLAQWFVHRHGGNEPVRLRRGSPESDIMQLFLSRRPDGVAPQCATDGATAIEVPYFRGKDPRVYTYMPERALAALANNIRVQFDVEMWADLHNFGNIGAEQQELIYAWMDKHGIECTETNWQAIAARYRRKRKNKSEKKQKNLSTSEDFLSDSEFSENPENPEISAE